MVSEIQKAHKSIILGNECNHFLIYSGNIGNLLKTLLKILLKILLKLFLKKFIKTLLKIYMIILMMIQMSTLAGSFIFMGSQKMELKAGRSTSCT